MSDECFNPRIAGLFPEGFELTSVGRQGWRGVKNGELVRLAASMYDCLITIDGSMEFQTNLSGVDLFVVVFETCESVPAYKFKLKNFSIASTSSFPGNYYRLNITNQE